MTGVNRIPNLKGQSGVEYLLTYGWAVLLIAIIITALFGLGVFNYNNLEQKALPGECWVYRPNGPGSTIDISTSGICSGLPPQSVLQLSSTSNSFVLMPKAVLNNLKTFSVAAWVDPTSSIAGGIYTEGQVATTCENFYLTGPSPVAVGIWNNGYSGNWQTWASSTTLTTNRWSFLVLTENSVGVAGSGIADIYLNGTLSSTNGAFQDTNTPTTPVQDTIGSGSSGCPGTWVGTFNGLIANVQVYNTTLSANAVEQLYVQGIGAGPINLNKLVGWWPLNGNGKDYSGNNNNGTVQNGYYTTNWQSSYSQP